MNVSGAIDSRKAAISPTPPRIPGRTSRSRTAVQRQRRLADLRSPGKHANARQHSRRRRRHATRGRLGSRCPTRRPCACCSSTPRTRRTSRSSTSSCRRTGSDRQPGDQRRHRRDHAAGERPLPDDDHRREPRRIFRSTRVQREDVVLRIQLDDQRSERRRRILTVATLIWRQLDIVAKPTPAAQPIGDATGTHSSGAAAESLGGRTVCRAGLAGVEGPRASDVQLHPPG